jgi:type I restriction enzyme S subunit
MSIRATVGTTAIVPSELDGANLTQGTARISPGPCTDLQYLLWHLRSSATQAWIARQVKGATFREITLQRLREVPIVIAPKNVQSRFSRIASSTLTVLEGQRRSRSQLDALFASLQHRAFRGEL